MNRARLRRFFRHGFFPQLVAFEACVRHGSVTRAAEELSLAQPTVSCLIRKLSETIGERVLETRARRMEPTPVGRELLGLCEEILDVFDRFDERHAALAAPGPVEKSGRAPVSRAVATLVPPRAGMRLTPESPELPAKVSSAR